MQWSSKHFGVTMFGLASLMHTAAAGGGSSGADHHWWHEEYEKTHVEAWAVIVFVLAAIFFETVHHQIMHHAEHGFVFGELHEKYCVDAPTAKHHSRHSLVESLARHSTSEFTVLGFIAFVIWAVNREGGFDSLVDVAGPEANGLMLPTSGTDYLHMLEDVHITIFLGMILYFSLIFQVACAARRIFCKWETMDLAHVGPGNIGKAHEPSKSNVGYSLSENFSQHCFDAWRSYFFMGVSHLQSAIPEMHDELQNCPQDLCISEGQTQIDSDEIVNNVLVPWFPFGKYLAMNVRLVMNGMIEFNRLTWLATIFVFAFIALLARYAHLCIREVYPVYIALIGILLIILGFWAQYVERRIDHASKFKARSQKFYSKFQMEVALIRVTQIVFFFLSYFTASALISKDLSNVEAIVTVSAFVLLHLMLRLFFGERIVRFLALASFGEYLSEDNWVFMKLLILAHKKGASQCEMSQLVIADTSLLSDNPGDKDTKAKQVAAV